uniref:Uncharacterized protein n=1 Tax=Ditylenchus dipsaci TaxID=166011 RepID=A0A915DSP4_9BILA
MNALLCFLLLISVPSAYMQFDFGRALQGGVGSMLSGVGSQGSFGQGYGNQGYGSGYNQGYGSGYTKVMVQDMATRDMVTETRGMVQATAIRDMDRAMETRDMVPDMETKDMDQATEPRIWISKLWKITQTTVVNAA